MNQSWLLTLHALRLLGFADTRAVAGRFQQDQTLVESHLIDAGMAGLVRRTSFAGTNGWSLSEKGRAENERLLATELDASGGRDRLADAYVEFLRLNADVVSACSAIQVTGRNAADSHESLRQAMTAWTPMESQLTEFLPRFTGYAARLRNSLAYADDPSWITGMDRDSYHRAWFELHEDLIATLGLQRE